MDLRKKEIRGILVELIAGIMYLMLTFLIAVIIMG